MTKQKIIQYQEFDNLNELPLEDKELVLAANEASLDSYSPYSQFKVGSAVCLDDGSFVQGSNQENVAYPSTLCAERVALFAAASNQGRCKIVAIATVAKKAGQFMAAIPCGACLQVMQETETRNDKPLKVIFALGNERFVKVEGVKNLLPFAFNEF